MVVPLTLTSLVLSGCGMVPLASLVVDTITGGAGIYQRYEDRATQQTQTAEIKALRQEIAAHREAVTRAATPSYVCVAGQVDGTAAFLCRPVQIE